ncbi:MAG: hypothetical protein CM1200mP18_09810 [Gammaproteobacteria bacterium]|nr:MAG: hypothetical protein CM1200mP18_09810 [Gammaproteobacteria bacterium]
MIFPQRTESLDNQIPDHQTPWQEIYRDTVGQLSTGGIIELATKYQNLKGYCSPPFTLTNNLLSAQLCLVVRQSIGTF